VQDQNSITFEYLKKSTFREKFKQKVTQLMDYPRYGCPAKHGSAYYYFHNSGLQAQSVLYKQNSLTETGRVFFDPNQLSEDGTVSLAEYSFSESGRYFAYALSNSGSDWVKIHFRSTEDGQETPLEDSLEWTKFTNLSWTHDDKGIFYQRYPKPSVDGDKIGTETDVNAHGVIHYHQLGTSQSQDIPIYKDESPETIAASTVTEDGKYLVLALRAGCDPHQKVYYLNLHEWSSSKTPFPTFSPIVEYSILM
jgi:prolyl oligopeptidase